MTVSVSQSLERDGTRVNTTAIGHSTAGGTDQYRSTAVNGDVNIKLSQRGTAGLGPGHGNCEQPIGVVNLRGHLRHWRHDITDTRVCIGRVLCLHVPGIVSSQTTEPVRGIRRTGKRR